MKTSISFLVLILAAAFSLQAAEYRGDDIIRVLETDTLSTDLLAGAQYVNILGYVDGDLYVGCQRMNITGRVHDDAIVFCEEMIVTGIVGDMVAGGYRSLVIDGEVGGDVLAGAAEVTITERGHIKGNLYTGTGKLTLDGGRVDGEIKGGAGSAFLNGKVGKGVELKLEDVKFGPEYSTVEGTKLKVYEDLDKALLKYIPLDLELEFEKKEAFYESWYFYWSFLATLIAGIVIAMTFRNTTRKLLGYAGTGLLKNTGVGLLVVILVPILILILLVLLLTIPLAMITVAVYLILLYIASIFGGLYIGDRILGTFRKDGTQGGLFWSLLLGIIIVTLVSEIPFLGAVISILIMCFGAGNIVGYWWGFRKVES